MVLVGTDALFESIGHDGPTHTCAGVVRHRRRAAGASWGLVTSNAPWGTRVGHTTVIDAAGNIYLMGGSDGSQQDIWKNDVWMGTNKGANRTRGVLEGYSRGTQEALHEAL